MIKDNFQMDVELPHLIVCSNYIIIIISSQTVLTACSLSSGLSTSLWLRIVNDLISRLPLSLITASSGNRPEAATSESVNSYLEIMSMCHKSCGVVFHVMVKNMHVLKDEDDFTHMWSRFISIVSTNAQSAHRGQWWHDDMTDMLMVLLQLLRLPDVPKGYEKCIPLSSSNALQQHSPMAILTSPNAKHAAQSGEIAHTTKTQHNAAMEASPAAAAAVGSSNSYLGWIGWIVGPPSTAAPDAGRSHMDAVVVEQQPVDDVQLQQHHHLVFEPTHIGVDEVSKEELAPQTGLDIQTGGSHDGRLLVIAWKTICSLHPVFAGHLKSRNLHLYNKLVSAVSYCEFLQSMTAAAERQTNVNANTTTATGVGEVNNRHAQVLSSPSKEPHRRSAAGIIAHSSSSAAASSIDDAKVVAHTAVVVDISSPTAAATTRPSTTAPLTHSVDQTLIGGARLTMASPPPGQPLAKTPRTNNTKSISSAKAAKPQIV